VEKKIRKKKKSCEEKGTYFIVACTEFFITNSYFLIVLKYISDVAEEEMRNTGDNSGVNAAVPNDSSNILINFPTTAPNLMQGGYTSLLLGIDQNAIAARKLNLI
jgi:hypothetical protein